MNARRTMTKAERKAVSVRMTAYWAARRKARANGAATARRRTVKAEIVRLAIFGAEIELSDLTERLAKVKAFLVAARARA